LARRVSKRKAPKREIKQLDVEDKIESRVFDRGTLIAIAKLTEKGYFETLDFPVSMGKEAVVFRGTKKDGTHVAVKIYRIETTSFLNMYEYLRGDPRFRNVRMKRFDIIVAWTRKEYVNLKTAYEAGVRCPYPIGYRRNIVVMEFLGLKGQPYPTLQVNGPLSPDDPKALEEEVEELLDDVRKMYRAGLVHADLSPYNILATENGLYIIDFSQAVSVDHPNALRFLRRDINNVVSYYNKFLQIYGLEKDPDEIFHNIVNQG